MEMNQVDGNNRGEVVLFTLSTCIWCKKTKALLQEMAVAYRFVDVDLLGAPEKEKALGELKRFNPLCSFPSLVVNNSTCIIGFDERKIKEVLKGE